MSWPSVSEFSGDWERRYQAVLSLQEKLNESLATSYREHRVHSRAEIANLVVEAVEDLVRKLNGAGYAFGRIDYGGDINFESSEQWYSNGVEMGDGLVLRFVGFTAQVSWVDA